jgi:hypothetical protein
MVSLSFTGCSKIWQKMTEEIQGLFQGGNTEGSSTEEDSVEDGAVRYGEAAVYHNSFLDFSYTVPRGWWLYSLNGDNFSADPEETQDRVNLDFRYGEDRGMKYSYLGLISFANLQYSPRDNHLGFDISAESLEGIENLEDYMNYFEAYMLEPDENEYELLESDRAQINGLSYERRVFEVIRDGGNYRYLTFTRPAANGCYLTIKVSYWPQNTGAEEETREALSRAMP